MSRDIFELRKVRVEKQLNRETIEQRNIRVEKLTREILEQKNSLEKYERRKIEYRNIREE